MKPQRSLLARLFSRKRWRVVQRITGVRFIHHVRWSFGWTVPFSSWVYFEDYGWKRIDHDREHHDCTKSGVY